MSFLQRRAEQIRREAAHATATAVCPTCQVAPGTECRKPDGRPLHDIHPARRTEAEGDAA
jgi:hypothetical protein